MHLLPSLRVLSSEAAAGDDDYVSPGGQAIQASKGKRMEPKNRRINSLRYCSDAYADEPAAHLPPR